MNASEKASKSEVAGISIALPPLSTLPTLPRLPSTVESPSLAPPLNQPPSLLNWTSLPMHLSTPRMVCLRATSQDCLSVTQTLYPMTSTSETGESSGHPIFIPTSPAHTMTPIPGSTLYSSSPSSGSVFMGSEGSKASTDGRRKRPASNLITLRRNKSRGVCNVGALSVEEAGSVALSPREQRALRRKEKSRLAAKLRRNQESNILFCLLRALPVSLPDTAVSEGSIKTTPSKLNLEKSGVIRMAGQTLFLYNSLSQVLGTKAVPFISLLSKSLHGLLVHPTDSTVVYATPPLAEAINWPWINLIGVKLESLTDEGKMPTRAGETVNLRVLEQTNSPAKSSVHNRPSTLLRSPSHSPTSTLSASTSGGDQTSPLWSPHLYRSSKNGTSGTFTGTHFSASASSNKAVPYLRATQVPICSHLPGGPASGPCRSLQPSYRSSALPSSSRKSWGGTQTICTCFAILRVPITRSEDGRPSATAESAPQPVNHLNLYLLQPTPNLGLPKATADSASLLTASPLGRTSSTTLSQISTISSSLSSSSPSASTSSSSSFHRNKERYLQNRLRRLQTQNPPPKPLEDDFVCPRDFFCIVLDRSLAVKWVENSDPNKTSIFSSMINQSFLDFIALQDLEAVSKLLNECVQQKLSIWTPSYRLRIPISQSNGSRQSSGPSKFIWVRTLFSNTFDANIRCLHQPIGNAQTDGIQVCLHQKIASTSTTGTSESRHHNGNSMSTVVATTPQVKRPIRVLKLQSHHQPLSQQPVAESTLQPLRVSPSLPTNSAPYLAPLAAAPTRDTQIIYEPPACLTPQTLVTTPWVIYTRSISAPQASLSKTVSPLSQNSSFNFLLPGECNEIPLQHSNKIPRLSPPHTIVESSQIERWPMTTSSPVLNLPDMLQELDPETLAMLEENEDAKSDSLLTSLSFDDILSSISITPSSGDELNQDKQICTSGSFCSSESSPPSLPESFVSSTSCTRKNQPSQQQQQLLQQREMSLFSDVELDTDMPSDTDEFWDALVTNVMNLPLDITNLPMDVR